MSFDRKSGPQGPAPGCFFGVFPLTSIPPDTYDFFLMEGHTRLYLIRHGQILGYDNFPVYGSTDVGLTDVGRLQMESLSERLRLVPIEAIYSSNLKRSVLGAQTIARYHDAALHALAELREMDFGDWEGLTLSEIRNRFPEDLDAREADIVNFRPPGDGESIAQLARRVLPCFKKILERQKGREFLILGHGGVNRVILCHALGLDLSGFFRLQQDYGCLNIVDYYPDSTQIKLLNG